MRLLFVSGEYPPDVGGVGDYTHRLRDALSAQHWPSQILTRRDVVRWDARCLRVLLRLARSVDVVHIEFQAGAFDLLGDVCLTPALLHRARPEIRVVTTFHDARVPYLFPRAGMLRGVAVRLLARTSDAVIAADERDLVALGGSSSRQHVVPIGSNIPCAPPHGYERATFRAALGVNSGALVVAYFGLLNASKGLHLLLEAFDRVAAARPDARLLLIGGDVGASDRTDRITAQRIRQRLAEPGLAAIAERTIVSGWQPPALLSAWLLAADLAVLPYVDGASPRRGSLLACAEHGLPIISTRPVSAAVADAVLPSDQTPEAVGQGILQVAGDVALAEHLAAGSRALAARAAWPRIAQAHVAIYQSLLRRGSAVPRVEDQG